MWGETMCRITEFGKDVFYGVSVFTLTALAAERYCAIVNPLRKLQVRELKIFRLSKTNDLSSSMKLEAVSVPIFKCVSHSIVLFLLNSLCLYHVIRMLLSI